MAHGVDAYVPTYDLSMNYERFKRLLKT